jgi:hypothetical protein
MTKYLYVNTISQFAINNVVEVPDDITDAEIEDIKQNILDNVYDDFSQRHIGVEIVSDRIIAKEQMLFIFDRENSYLADWSEQQKIEYVRNLEHGRD